MPNGAASENAGSSKMGSADTIETRPRLTNGLGLIP